MNKWQETVKRVSKQHPGKSLREILPLAKLEYKKMGHASSAPTKKHRKHHKKSHSGKKSHGRKRRRGSRRMRGGQGCAAASSTDTPVVNTNSVSSVQDWDNNWSSGYAEVNSSSSVQSGGSHCGTHHRRRRRRLPTRKRRPKRRKMRGGGGCGGGDVNAADDHDHVPASE